MNLIFEHDDAQLWYDSRHRILKAIWFNDVSLEAFKGLVTEGVKIMEAVDSAHIMFDRRHLDGFSVEARIWLKHDFMNRGGDGRRLIKKIRKIAAIQTPSAMGQIAVSVFSKILLFFNPKLLYNLYSNDKEAYAWLKNIPSMNVLPTVVQKGNAFSRFFGF